MSYVDDLKEELRKARQNGDKEHEKQVLAELKRSGAPENTSAPRTETKTAPKTTETRKQKG